MSVAGSPEIHGVCVVQNEGDVIAESLAWASRFCDAVWVWDLGSSDDTWERIREAGARCPEVRAFLRPDVAFSKTVRGQLFRSHRDEIPEDAWVYKLDADEFLNGDPRPVLRRAAAADDDLVRAWQLDFYPTPDDLAALRAAGEEAWVRTPLAERLRSYRVTWKEWRFVRIGPGFAWDARDGRNRMRRDDRARLRRSPLTLSVRHYRYRSPEQVRRRFLQRTRLREAGYGGFRYDGSAEFADYVGASRLRRWKEHEPVPRVTVGDRVRYEAERLWNKSRRRLAGPTSRG